MAQIALVGNDDADGLFGFSVCVYTNIRYEIARLVGRLELFKGYVLRSGMLRRPGTKKKIVAPRHPAI
jgi:hypothetical protein